MASLPLQIGRALSFANTSLGEDYDFALRAVRNCYQLLVVANVQSMYTKHEGKEATSQVV